MTYAFQFKTTKQSHGTDRLQLQVIKYDGFTTVNTRRILDSSFFILQTAVEKPFAFLSEAVSANQQTELQL